MTATAEVRERVRVERLMKEKNAVFVFGSNLAGVHGAGAARDAQALYGAEWAVGEGLMGRCYALPTKGNQLVTLPLSSIAANVARFLNVARSRPDLTFAVTRVGCGLANLTETDIVPLFANAPSNCQLPVGWRTMNGEE
jgi:hypothetical protein